MSASVNTAISPRIGGHAYKSLTPQAAVLAAGQNSGSEALLDQTMLRMQPVKHTQMCELKAGPL